MVRQVITDQIWEQLESTLRLKGCHRWKNDRNIMEAILWKLRTGAPWRDIPAEFCSWKTALGLEYNDNDVVNFKALTTKLVLASVPSARIIFLAEILLFS